MLIPERQLWAAVLIQAINDAMRVDAYSPEDRRAKDDAISWLNKGGRDFITVCTLAGMEPEAVADAWRSGRMERITTKHRAVTVVAAT